MPRTMTIAYCGPAAIPADLLTRWNFDPVLIVGLMLLAVATASGRSANARASWAALLLMVFVFVSPLCALSSALFSARVFHHVLLVSAVAPLLAVAFPLRRMPYLPLPVLVAAQTLIFWGWHMPLAYEWGLSSVGGYWLMQATLLGSAWLVWRGVFAPATDTGAALVALVTTVAQMGLLAALIVFSPRALYAVHFETTQAWGMSPLADQQLAGLLMWMPAALPYAAIGLVMAWASLRPTSVVATGR